jgi:allophanate hydrolase
LVPISLGTDTAGSGRVPAGLNNIVGLKPTLGALSTTGIVPACRSLDCVSIFALTVEDAYAALQVAMGFDPSDSYSRPITLETSGLPSHLWVGVPDAASRRFGGDKASEAAFDAAVADLKKLGAEIKLINMSAFFDIAALLYQGPWVAERYQGIRDFIESSASSLHPTTCAIIESATKFSAADAFAGFYKLAELRRATEAVWREVDILLVPTFPRPRTIADLEKDPIGPNSELGTYTNFVNLLDLCALAVPGRFRSDGLPSGVTLIGPAGMDAQLAAFGARLHHAAGVPLGATGKSLASSWTGPSAGGNDNEIELVVVGAHMSGLPLNGELAVLGARFVREADTQSDYRLFALPGGPPHRPGLLRVEDGAGSAIKTEVWALSAAAFGAFVSKVPAPLSIGTVRLADGTAPKGFVVEAQATIGARDISGFGGWRAFVQQALRA